MCLAADKRSLWRVPVRPTLRLSMGLESAQGSLHQRVLHGLVSAPGTTVFHGGGAQGASELGAGVPDAGSEEFSSRDFHYAGWPTAPDSPCECVSMAAVAKEGQRLAGHAGLIKSKQQQVPLTMQGLPIRSSADKLAWCKSVRELLQRSIRNRSCQVSNAKRRRLHLAAAVRARS